MGPLGYAWIWKWLTICIYYQTLTLLNHPFGGPMIHIHLYIHPTSHPNHSLEHIRRWVPWRMTCHLCASWGLGCCFLRIPVSDPHMRTLESKFRYPMIFGGYKLGWHHNRNSTARSRFPKQFPHLQRQRHGPLHAILHVRGWTLVAVGTATSLDGTATKKNDQHLTARQQDIVAH